MAAEGREINEQFAAGNPPPLDPDLAAGLVEFLLKLAYKDVPVLENRTLTVVNVPEHRRPRSSVAFAPTAPSSGRLAAGTWLRGSAHGRGYASAGHRAGVPAAARAPVRTANRTHTIS